MATATISSIIDFTQSGPIDSIYTNEVSPVSSISRFSIDRPLHPERRSRYTTDVTQNGPILNGKVLHLQTTDSTIKLEVPDVKHYSPPSPLLKTTAQTYDDLVTVHQEYFEKATPWSFDSLTTEQRRIHAARAVHSIAFVFPQVDDRNALLCMVAWLCFVCEFDDIIEAMPESSEVSAVLTVVENIFSTNFKSRHDSESSISSQTLSGKIVHIAEHFARHTLQLLQDDTDVSSRFLELCVEFLYVLRQEDQFRRNKSSNLEKYLAIRLQTMALGPFFYLIDNCRHRQASEQLQNLRLLVALGVGIQNDLVGVEKDLDRDEYMNAIIVASGVHSLAKDQRHISQIWSHVEDLAIRHNDIVRRAYQEYAIIMQRDISESERQIAGQVFCFLARHLEWMAKIKRYNIDHIPAHGM